ncbi:MAG: hypothetical protein ABEN55_06265, partial [Bradymonadaceae bacterium]
MSAAIGVTVLSLAVLPSAGCSDRAEGDDWELNAENERERDTAVATDTGTAGETDDDDTGIRVQDTGIRPDTRTRQDATATDDAGGTIVERTGWYVTGFERSEFIPRGRATPRGEFDGDECTVGLQNPQRSRKKWWANWLPESEVRSMTAFPPGSENTAWGHGLYDARGRLSDEGRHGHLGEYDRKFQVTEAELDVCGSVRELGHCVVPQAPDAHCVTANRTTAGRRDSRYSNAFRKKKFVKHVPGVGGYVSFELILEQPVDHGTTIRLSFTRPMDPSEPYYTLDRPRTDLTPAPTFQVEYQ